MKIALKRLTIINFKGIQSQEIEFNHTTNVYGDNATGKTSIFDAFLWLFFGKNCEGVSQFEVKRLDGNNNFIPNIESEVCAIVQVDNQEIAIKKVLRQKWVKRRGELQENYNGDENVYFWNDVPFKEGEFKAKVKAIVDEMLFRLITNPFFFNSLKWQERRNTLIEIAGNISNDEVFDSCITASNKGQFGALITALNQGKSVDEFKREIAAKKKRIKDEAESIPSRIDEVRRGMPNDENFEALNLELAQLQKEQKSLENILNDERAQEKEANDQRTQKLKDYNQLVQDRQKRIFDIQTELRNINFQAKQEASEKSGKIDAQINSLRSSINEKESELNRYSSSINTLKSSIQIKEQELNGLREKYAQVDAEELKYDESGFHCPACKQSLPEADIESKKEELSNNFNSDKVKRLTAIHTSANDLKAEIEAIQTRIANGNTAILGLETELTSLKVKIQELLISSANEEPVETIVEGLLAKNANYQSLLGQLKEQESIVLIEPLFEEINSDGTTKSRFIEVNNRINDIRLELNKKDQIEAANKRVIELKDQETALAQELATLEGVEYAILQFTKAKVDSIEKRINGKFKTVKFKMFETQVNGGEVECCETLVNSNGSFVPFADANNAAKINAGIDIINTLCAHYQIYAPIFIDNRESVTKLIDSDSQIVNLIVSAQDKKLRVA